MMACVIFLEAFGVCGLNGKCRIERTNVVLLCCLRLLGISGHSAFPVHCIGFRLPRMLVYWFIEILPKLLYISSSIAVIDVPVHIYPTNFQFVWLQGLFSI